MNYLTNINLNRNQIQNAVMHPLAVAPENATEGQVYYNSTDKLLYVYNGSAWAAVGKVTSVNNKTGAVTLTQDDIGDGSTYVRTHNDFTTALKTLLQNTPLAIANAYNETASYAVGDYTIKDGLLYQCNTPIGSGGEAWTAGHWTQVKVTDIFAPLASPALTGTPTAPTAAAGTNTTQIATTEFVTAAIAALGNAMSFKGIVNSASDLPTAHTAGWVYKVGTAGIYAGVTCEVGDTIICVTTGSVASDGDWYVLQANIDGAVTGPASAVNGHLAAFDGTTGKAIKDGYGVASAVTNDADTIPTTAAVNTAIAGFIRTNTGTIGTSATSVPVSFTGTFVYAYATMGGELVSVDIAPTASTVTFSCSAAPSSAITCTVVYASMTAVS